MSAARLAVPDDADVFMSLAEEYLTELRSLGSEVLVTERTLAFWAKLFEIYTEDDADGVVVVAGDYGFSVAGSFGQSPHDTTLDKCAYGYGTYVSPSHRQRNVSKEMREVVREALVRKGFSTIIGGVHCGNAAGLASAKRNGFTEFQVIGYVRLDPEGAS